MSRTEDPADVAHASQDEWVARDCRQTSPCATPFEHVLTEGMRLERRRHEGANELPEGHFTSNLVVLTLRSPRRLEVSEDGKWKKSSPQLNDMTIIPAGMPFASRWDGPTEFIAISIAPITLRRVVASDSSNSTFQILPSWTLKQPLLAALARALCSDVTGDRPIDRIYRDTLCAAFATCLIRESSHVTQGIATARAGLPARSLQQVLDYINARLDAQMSLAELASVAGSSMHHFARLFKQSTGSAPHQYVLQQRIERAASLLRSTPLPIAEIAHRCGFNDQSHLANSFKRRQGQSPSAFRRAH